jgi:hypothetical protein
MRPPDMAPGPVRGSSPQLMWDGPKLKPSIMAVERTAWAELAGAPGAGLELAAWLPAVRAVALAGVRGPQRQAEYRGQGHREEEKGPEPVAGTALAPRAPANRRDKGCSNRRRNRQELARPRGLTPRSRNKPRSRCNRTAYRLMVDCNTSSSRPDLNRRQGRPRRRARGPWVVPLL